MFSQIPSYPNPAFQFNHDLHIALNKAIIEGEESCMVDCQEKCSFIQEANYMAICILEKLGLDEPTEKQINIIEIIILLAIQPDYLTLKMLNDCIGNDALGREILLRHMRNVLNVVKS